MLRTDPEERPQDLGAFAERIRACLQKAERRTAFTRSFAPAAIPSTQKVKKKRVAPALALAAAIVVVAALGAFLLPPRLANRERKPLGVLIGVPETTPEESPISESSASPVALPQQDEQSPVIAQQYPALPPAPVAAAAPAANAENQSTQQSPVIAQQSPAQTASPVGAPETTEKLTSPQQLAANNRMAEPPAPAEGPAQTSQPLITAEAVQPAEKSEPPPGDAPDNAGTADSSSTAAEKAKPSTSSENVKKRDDSRASKRKSRRQRVVRSSVPHPLAPLRVGPESARVVGTTPNGNWVLRLPSGETVIAPPVPNLEDAPIVTPRHIRRVERPPWMEDEPPIMVLPPGY
jgi:hypothetical protein